MRWGFDVSERTKMKHIYTEVLSEEQYNPRAYNRKCF